MLKELEKATPPGHPDAAHVAAALDSMRGIAAAINENKRNVEDLVRLQARLEGWEGADLAATCSELLLEGPLAKISDGRNQERYFFLFDNLLVYCKRSLKGSLGVRGKILTGGCTVLDLADDEVKHGRAGVKNALQISNPGKNKWYTLVAKTAQEKEQWVFAFRREREKVEENRRLGLSLDAAAAAFEADHADHTRKVPRAAC